MPRSARRTAPRLVALLGLSILLGGCGGDDQPERDAERPNLPAPVAQSSNEEDPAAGLRAALGPEAEKRLHFEDGRVVAANLAGLEIEDLSMLRGLPLVMLDLKGTQVKDLSPLQGMPLRELFLEDTPVADVSPLKGMPLEKLWLKNTGVADLSALEGMSLAELSLFGTPVEDLSFMENVAVETLWLVDTNIKDLSPLRGRSLVSLDVQGAPVSDLAPLAGMSSLRRLNIIGTRVTDLSPLSRLSLDRLLLTPETIETGWDAVRQMPSLRTIDTVPLEKLEELQRPPMSAAEFWRKFDAGAFRK